MLDLPAGLRAYLVKTFAKSFTKESTANEVSHQLTSALEMMVRFEFEADGDSTTAPTSEKQRSKSFGEACRRRGTTIARRLDRNSELNARAVQAVSGSEKAGASDANDTLVVVLKEAEEATRKSKECGEASSIPPQFHEMCSFEAIRPLLTPLNLTMLGGHHPAPQATPAARP